MQNLILKCTTLLKQSQGIDISMYDDDFVKNAFLKRIEMTNSPSADAYAGLFSGSMYEAMAFVDLLQVNYSEFFRNPLTFAVLEHIALPSLLFQSKARKKKGIRIWSAACAEGQEIYSLAMLLEELSELATEKPGNLLFATDKNETSVMKATRGIYPQESLGNLSLKRCKRWFNLTGRYYSVVPELKKNIAFSVFDLLDDRWTSPPTTIFGDFNLVFCANILFYFKEPYRKIILGKIVTNLSSGGLLVTGETERDILLQNNFTEIYPHSAIFRKNSST
jgi:chemotaxis protein methyltransferase CheR